MVSVSRLETLSFDETSDMVHLIVHFEIKKAKFRVGLLRIHTKEAVTTCYKVAHCSAFEYLITKSYFFAEQVF